MAENQSITIPAHHNIYNGSTGRGLRIDFSYPSAGVTTETGLLLIVPGFGGNIESKVYRKMRDRLADDYNLVTLQCAYFGDLYMQGAENFTLQNTEHFVQKYLDPKQQLEFRKKPTNLLSLLSSKAITLPVLAQLNETMEEFNDMGFMQAIDLITAIDAIIIILKENGLSFNEQKIIGYGHSHGAYLLHLVNRMAPHLISTIIDNSSWIEPVYLTNNRYLFQKLNELTIQIEFEYLAKKVIKDKQSLNLATLYCDFDNQTEIMSFQGTDDNLINHREKQAIISGIDNAKFILVNEKDVDQIVFKSNGHGLDADFLKMFEMAYNECNFEVTKVEKKKAYKVVLSNTTIYVDYSQGLPLFQLE
ncbi:DUF2920 family protein [Sporosarcina koreensis]|uniref:DUF2920 family protein n=1 Tax=Sporosarcina koreensis TaxID=334735 RepID=A0ABW0U3C2_9BACL